MSEGTVKTSIRYGGGAFDARSALIRLYGFLQRKEVVILKSDSKLCGELLAASDTKGTFIEHLFATPAWSPIYSVESMDGERWEQLARDFKNVMAATGWRERLGPLVGKYAGGLAEAARRDPSKIVDSETIARTVVSILYELLFSREISPEDQSLFYSASLEWRKEIAIKGKGDPEIKYRFLGRVRELVAESPFKDGLEAYPNDPAAWLSVFAQPFLISPQINIGDILVTVFRYLREDPAAFERARSWARAGDRARLEGVALEAIRLRHPFPVLERELKREFSSAGKRYAPGTQIFVMLDQFEQDRKFDPERWLQAPAENPYAAIPFAAGPRMCVGKPIALELLSGLLGELLLEFPEDRVQPQLGHRFSGRENDARGTLKEALYQLGVFARGLRSCVGIGRRESTGCPWKKLKGKICPDEIR